MVIVITLLRIQGNIIHLYHTHSYTNIQYTHTIHPHNTPTQYTHTIHSHNTPTQYTHTIHSHNTLAQYTHTIHPHTKYLYTIQYTHNISLLYMHASLSSPLTHTHTYIPTHYNHHYNIIHPTNSSLAHCTSVKLLHTCIHT
jgi:hypothetical protein